MANILEETNIDPKTYFTPASRYADAIVSYYGELKRLTINTYVRTPIPAMPQDRFMVIGKGKEYRPDLVSMAAYGLPDYWWRIMEANGIYDIYEFKAGVNIRIPTLI